MLPPFEFVIMHKKAEKMPCIFSVFCRFFCRRLTVSCVSLYMRYKHLFILCAPSRNNRADHFTKQRYRKVTT